MGFRRRVLALVAGLLALSALAAVLLPRFVRPDSGDAALAPVVVPQSRPGPVLLVPGYGGGTAALSALARRLQETGREAHVVPAVADGRGDLRVQAAALDAAARAAVAGGAPSVDVVGFSAGGVVARLWAADYDGTRRARRIVTLGAPHHGAELAATAAQTLPSSCPQACEQLRPDSSLLRALNRRDETPDGPQWTSVWTTADTVVTPPESARLEGAVNVALQSVCDGVRLEHGQLPTDPLPVGVVLQALGPGLDAPPPASDCPTLVALGRP